MSPRDGTTTPTTRRPEAQGPRRMQPLATLPLFFMLDQRRVVMTGGTEAVAWKAELLSAAGANVEVWHAAPCQELEMLASAPPNGSVSLIREQWTVESLKDAALVVGAAENELEAARLFEAAQKHGVPVNVIDRPRYCTFQFGAVVNRSPLVVGISTAGAAPIFGQAVRSRIEALLPSGFRRWADAARIWRTHLAKRGLSRATHRRFWEKFTDRAFAAPDRAPETSELEELIALAHDQGALARVGQVTLVGAGPGNAELLTLRAIRALRSADVILFDDLVAPDILDFARREAKRLLVGKTGYGPSCRQDDINALMVGLAKAGRRVVRLKAGDPMIFGRATEEIAALKRSGIPVEIVPGVTAAQGAAATLQVSLTEREAARRVQFLTGHARGGRLPVDLDLAALCDPKVTTAVYMPLGTLRELTKRLAAAGADPRRPVSAVFNATRPDERVVAGTLGTIADALDKEGTSGPCVLLIGEVLRGAASFKRELPRIGREGKASGAGAR